MCSNCFEHAKIKIDVSNESYVKELKDMLDKNLMKEINFKIKKLGVVHYFGVVCQQDADLDPQICEDCGKETVRYMKVTGGWKNEANIPIWKTICDTCIKAYKSEDPDKPMNTKLGVYNGANISKTTKLYKPYLKQCVGCKKDFDIHKTPVYNYQKGEDIKTYCRCCFKSIIGVDPVNLSE